MQRLREQSQRRLDSKAPRQPSDGRKMLFVFVLFAWAGTSSTQSAGSLEHRSSESLKNHSQYTDASPLKGISPLFPASRVQDSKADAFATGYEKSGSASIAPTTARADELTCLALNIYWEARNQSMAGQLAVAQVTLNRVSDPRYADNVCDVVYEHKQFSWYWDGKSDTPKEPRAWEKANLIASAALHGSRHVAFRDVTHYHAVYIEPFWKDYMVQIAMIGDHVFYAAWQ